MVSHAYLDDSSQKPGGRTCPFCDAVATTVRDEIAHMESRHPSIIVNRLHAAGLHMEADEFAAAHRL